MENKIVRQYDSENTDRCRDLLLDKYILKLPAEAKRKELFYMKPKSVAPPWTPLLRGYTAFLLESTVDTC